MLRRGAEFLLAPVRLLLQSAHAPFAHRVWPRPQQASSPGTGPAVPQALAPHAPAPVGVGGFLNLIYSSPSTALPSVDLTAGRTVRSPVSFTFLQDEGLSQVKNLQLRRSRMERVVARLRAVEQEEPQVRAQAAKDARCREVEEKATKKANDKLANGEDEEEGEGGEEEVEEDHDEEEEARRQQEEKERRRRLEREEEERQRALQRERETEAQRERERLQNEQERLEQERARLKEEEDCREAERRRKEEEEREFHAQRELEQRLAEQAAYERERAELQAIWGHYMSQRQAEACERERAELQAMWGRYIAQREAEAEAEKRRVTAAAAAREVFERHRNEFLKRCQASIFPMFWNSPEYEFRRGSRVHAQRQVRDEHEAERRAREKQAAAKKKREAEQRERKRQEAEKKRREEEQRERKRRDMAQRERRVQENRCKGMDEFDCQLSALKQRVESGEELGYNQVPWPPRGGKQSNAVVRQLLAYLHPESPIFRKAKFKSSADRERILHRCHAEFVFLNNATSRR